MLLLGWLLAGSAIAASGAPASLPVLLVGGRSYVSLADWARANRLSAQWIKRDEAVEVIGPKSRAVFQVFDTGGRIAAVSVNESGQATSHRLPATCRG